MTLKAVEARQARAHRHHISSCFSGSLPTKNIGGYSKQLQVGLNKSHVILLKLKSAICDNSDKIFKLPQPFLYTMLYMPCAGAHLSKHLILREEGGEKKPTLKSNI